MERCPFTTRDPRHKYPFGAVSTGSKLTIRIKMPRHMQCSYAFFVIHRDDCYNPESHSMVWDGMEGSDREWWKIEYTLPETAGLYWYHFEMVTPYGRSRIFSCGNGEGKIGAGSEDFQLTVYDKNFKTPDWLKGGVIYQIFPDRFCREGKLPEAPAGKTVHENWNDEPNWRPDEHGKILNNDFFGGNFRGIEKKLDYLKLLGVTCIYLNPIFEAYSNHRYDTGDYSKPDSMLGTQEDFKSLCQSAAERGIRIVLDGVFSHTGDDSIYFNKKGNYPSIGAYQSENSPYYSWYKFRNGTKEYDSWWGIETLPEVHENSPEFIEFITGENGIVRRWLRAGASGWRLDVADELPDEFLDELRKGAKEEKSDAVIIGEVWENASNKYSYGCRRRYLLGDQLDSVMNYPFASAILHYIRSGNADQFENRIMDVLETYPPQVISCLMNHIGTHDTTRAITFLAGEACRHRDRQWQSGRTLSAEQLERGVRLMKMASALQYTLPGVPSLYYGDEAGAEGYEDPFNRGTFPWGRENKELQLWYGLLGKIRAYCPALVDGDFKSISSGNGCVAFSRQQGEEILMTIVNRNSYTMNFVFPPNWECAECLTGEEAHFDYIDLPPMSVAILGKGDWIEKIAENGLPELERW